MLLKYRFLSVLVNKTCRYRGRRHLLCCHVIFGVTWPFLPNMAKPLLGVLCWAVFCAFVSFKGWEWAPIHTIFNDNTLATFFQLSRVGFVFIQMSITTWKQGKNLLNCLKSLQLALRAVIWGWIQITLHKSLHWAKIVIVWHSGCCFPSKCRAPLKNKAKILLFLASTFGYYIKLLRASLCKILISSFAHKMDFAHNFSVDFF